MRSVLLLIGFLTHFNNQTQPSLTEMRRLYQKSAESLDSLKKLSGLLENIDNQSGSVVYLSYKGAATMLQAKYQVNPFSKLSSFKNGKILIESAIRQDSTALEPRYLRFTIQTNLPSFLNYSAGISADKTFLLAHYPEIDDAELKKIVFQYLSTSKFCTEQELKKLKN